MFAIISELDSMLGNTMFYLWKYLSVLPAPVSSGTRPVWRYLPGWSLSSAGTQGGNYGHTVSNDDGSSLLEGGRQRCGHQGLNHHSSSLSHNLTRSFIKPRKTEALFLEETNFLKDILCHYSLQFKKKPKSLLWPKHVMMIVCLCWIITWLQTLFSVTVYKKRTFPQMHLWIIYRATGVARWLPVDHWCIKAKISLSKWWRL